MITPNRYCPDWVKRFALFPVQNGGYTIWLQFYWKRYVEVKSEDKCRHCNVVGYFEITPLNPCSVKDGKDE